MTNAGGTIGVPISSRQFAPGRSAITRRIELSSLAIQRVNVLPAFLALLGIILPTEIQIYLGDAKFTPGRISIILLLFPALFVLSRKGRRAVLSDFLRARPRLVW